MTIPTFVFASAFTLIRIWVVSLLDRTGNLHKIVLSRGEIWTPPPFNMVPWIHTSAPNSVIERFFRLSAARQTRATKGDVASRAWFRQSPRSSVMPLFLCSIRADSLLGIGGFCLYRCCWVNTTSTTEGRCREARSCILAKSDTVLFDLMIE